MKNVIFQDVLLCSDRFHVVNHKFLIQSIGYNMCMSQINIYYFNNTDYDKKKSRPISVVCQ